MPGSKPGTASADAQPVDIYKLRALEIWGGNQAATERAAVPGFEIYSYCEPYRGAAGGGDVRFVSTCAAGHIVRCTLADVAGHGESASEVALHLRTLMRKHINTPNPTRFARALNSEFRKLAEAGRFATAVISTYFAPTDHMIVCNAGHPRPLLYRAGGGPGAARGWELFDQSSPGAVQPARSRQTGISNLPLGILDAINYPQSATRLFAGDIMISYSDALIEASNPAGNELGEAGILAIARTIDLTDPAKIGPSILGAVAAHRGGRPADDDVTLIVQCHNGGDPPPMPLGDRLRALVGLAKERPF